MKILDFVLISFASVFVDSLTNWEWQVGFYVTAVALGLVYAMYVFSRD